MSRHNPYSKPDNVSRELLTDTPRPRKPQGAHTIRKTKTLKTKDAPSPAEVKMTNSEMKLRHGHSHMLRSHKAIANAVVP